MTKIRFLLDEHVPHTVADGLRRRGIDVLTANDTGLRGSHDEEYLARSRDEGWVVVTHDADFLQLQYQLGHAGIVYCEQGARSIGQLVAGLVLIFEVLEPSEMVGEVQFL